MNSAVECRTVSVTYGSVTAVSKLDLSVGEGETFALLGPSGSGKTSLLHAIAGFVPISSGSIRIDGVEVASAGTGLSPEKRGVGFVFQNYALWPHLDAVSTVAYPLLREGWKRTDAQSEAMRLLDQVGIRDLAGRLPAEMSGGQQQRVGLARALARRGSIFLFDEPTAHLDASLRTLVAQEIADRQSETGAGAVYATHDAAEALALADRVGLMRSGKLVQTGTPEEVYERPVDEWSAQLTGPISVISAPAVKGSPGSLRLRIGHEIQEVRGKLLGHGARWLIRPDWVEVGRGALSARVAAVRYRGTHTDYELATEVGVVTARRPGPARWATDELVRWEIGRVWALPA